MTPKNFVCGLTVGFLVATTVMARDESVQSSPVAVHIVPTSSHFRTGQAIELYAGKHFHVVVQNLSDKPIKLWQEWCSWGYFNLSFEAQYLNGQVFSISKKDKGWDKNFPCPTEIGSGAPWVIDVDLNPAVWENSPLTSSDGTAVLQLKAIFEIREDANIKADRIWAEISNQVWTGTHSSPKETYTLYWQGIGSNAALQKKGPTKKSSRRLRRG